jgi:hypothetical protein
VRILASAAIIGLLCCSHVASGASWEYAYIHGWPTLAARTGTADVEIDGRTIEMHPASDDDLVFSGTVRGKRVRGTLGYLEVPHESGHMLVGTVHRTRTADSCRVVVHLTDGLHVLSLASTAPECGL